MIDWRGFGRQLLLEPEYQQLFRGIGMRTKDKKRKTCVSVSVAQPAQRCESRRIRGQSGRLATTARPHGGGSGPRASATPFAPSIQVRRHRAPSMGLSAMGFVPLAPGRRAPAIAAVA